ncbi:ABC transporter ATP-binding protein [Telmatospirillum sp. J64-1]|uniref:ABC transporter ATP-binding protein n=1 Tax=Telmatospirillum sp. J64-1 TaxID=2502183 RepID=UPI00115EFDE5|nr:ABC transporter ATP-binding protein [Telmatospirillum sp. J64-1]
MSYLSLVSLEKRYGETLAVKSLSLEIERGQLVSLLGPSGCGKTTTLRMVAGFIEPTRGMILIDGQQVHRQPPHRRNIGMVFQNYALFPHMTVFGNVEFGLKMRRLPSAERRQRVGEALEIVGLAHLAERYPAQLSGGQQQRIALARALVIRPDVLLLDEPLSNLDATLRAEMRVEIRRIQQELGITTLFVTHDQDEALSMSDRIVVMASGELVEDAPPVTLSERPHRLFTASFLGARTVLRGKAVPGPEGKVFVADCGLVATLPEAAPLGANHMVLRAARLGWSHNPPERSQPFMTEAKVREVTYLGDDVEMTVEAAGQSIRLIRPSSETPPETGAAIWLFGDSSAVAFLSEPLAHA